MQVTILASSDIHGRMTSHNFEAIDQPLSGGLARVASVVEEERAVALDPVIYLDNGDFIQGNPLASFYQRRGDGRKLMAGLQSLDPLAFSLGNHEFNYGRDYLERIMYSGGSMALCGNVLINDKPAFGPAFVTKKFGPVKVGVLGITTPFIKKWENPDHIKGLTFISALEACQRWIPVLKDQEQCDIVVVAYHGGFETHPVTGEQIDQELGENEGYAILQSGLPIDVLITGHQHRSLAEEVNGIALVQPGSKGDYVAKVVVDVARDANRHIQATIDQVSLIDTGDFPESETITEMYDKDIAHVDRMLAEEIARTDGRYKVRDVFEAQKSGHPYIDLLNQIKSDLMEADLSATSLFNDQVEGLGELVTLRDLVHLYTYPVSLAKVELTGAQLRDILEYNAQYFTLDSQVQVTIRPDYLSTKKLYANYDIYSGIDYSYDLTQPVGQRLVRLQREGQDVKDSDVFTLAISHFRASGAGGFPHLNPGQVIENQTVDMVDVMKEYLTKEA